MSNPSPKTAHLVKTQWAPGQSGNPLGKPKGSIHISTHISNLLEDENFECKLNNGQTFKGIPIKAVINVLIIKALNGNLRAFELLAKFGYTSKPESNTEASPLPILGGISSDPEELS